MPLHWRAWQAVATRYGLDFPEDRFYALGGVPSRDILKMLSQRTGPPPGPHRRRRRKRRPPTSRSCRRCSRSRPSCDIAREHYGKIPWPSPPAAFSDHINEVLEHLGIRQLFQAVVTSEDVARQKPAPDIFLEAARRLGVPAAILPRLRGHRPGPASHPRRRHGRRGCAPADPERQDVLVCDQPTNLLQSSDSAKFFST